jgi:hypothetical protein
MSRAIARQVPNHRIETIDPETAKHWLLEYNFGRQRNIRRKWVSYLAEQMRLGRFRRETSIEFTKTPDGRLELIDGQHRLSAVVESGIAQPFLIHVITLDAQEDAALLYGTTDAHTPRTQEDYLQFAGIPQQLGLSRRQTRSIARAVGFMKNGFMLPRSTEQDRVIVRSIIEDWALEGVEAFKMVKGKSNTIQRIWERSAILSVILVTLRHAEADAKEFWSAVAADDGLRRVDPRKVCYEALMTMTSRADGKVDRQTTRIVTPHYQARAVAGCWNRWVNNDPPSSSTPKVFDDTAPIKILKTPFKGK